MTDPLLIADGVAIALEDVQMSAVRAQGAGGQHVNKVSSAIHLRFSIPASGLPDGVKTRLLASGDGRLTQEGVFVLKAQSHRSQERNRAEALERLQTWATGALKTSKKRVATRPSKGAKRRRLEGKKRRSEVKSSRRKPSW